MEGSWCVNKTMNCFEVLRLSNLIDSLSCYLWLPESLDSPDVLPAGTIATSEWQTTCIIRQVTRSLSHSHIILKFRHTSDLYLMDSAHLVYLVCEHDLEPVSWCLYLVLWQSAGQCIKSFSHYFKVFSSDWLSFSLDIGIWQCPPTAICRLL